jgi:hypothetical protein
MKAASARSDPGYKVKAEFNDKPHDLGVLSMARSQTRIRLAASFSFVLGVLHTSIINTQGSGN